MATLTRTLFKMIVTFKPVIQTKCPTGMHLLPQPFKTLIKLTSSQT